MPLILTAPGFFVVLGAGILIGLGIAHRRRLLDRIERLLDRPPRDLPQPRQSHHFTVLDGGPPSPLPRRDAR